MSFLDTIAEAQRGFAALGPLEAYDDRTFGPLLGVSDSGQSAQLIFEALADSAKIRAGGIAGANGLVIDAERMGSAGEVPVGPAEYAVVGPVALGRTWYTTNVGVRANSRHLQARPELPIAEVLAEGVGDELLARQFEPFLNPPGGSPRPLTVLVSIPPLSDLGRFRDVGAAVERLRNCRLADPHLHKIGLVTVFDTEPNGPEVEWAANLLGAAADAGIPIVAFDGPVEEAARIRISVQGLLQLFDAPEAARLMAIAVERGISIQPRFMVDCDTISRTIWTGLFTARSHGLSAAKYGLTPLTLTEQRRVIRDIQGWSDGWTAVPAFYADTPLVTDNEVFLSDRVVEAALVWLKMVSEFGVQIVLFDCPDRFVPRIDVSGEMSGRRMLRSDAQDQGGTFTLEQVEEVLARAKDLRVRILWSGGLSATHAFELARRHVSGIFTTSSTALPGPVTPILVGDPRLARENLPTRSGVRRVHSLIQAGFLLTALQGRRPDLVQELDGHVGPVLSAGLETSELDLALAELDEVLARAWPSSWGLEC